MAAKIRGRGVTRMLNTETSIRFVTFRDVILTVKSRLLGADLKDSIEWIRKYFACDYHRSLRRSNNLPMVFVFSQDLGYAVADDDYVSISLFEMVLRHQSFFKESCFDTHCFDLDILNHFFSKKKIEIEFHESPPLKRDIETHFELPLENDEVNGKDASKYSSQEILFLRRFRDDDPLALAIDIRNKEWASFDPAESDTRVKQESIVKDLIGRGFSKKQAESIELVACPIKRK